MQEIETERERRIHQIGGGVEQQRDTLRLLGVEGKIKCLVGLDPGRTQRQRAALTLRPSQAFRQYGRGLRGAGQKS